jgi:hypothetical protein
MKIKHALALCAGIVLMGCGESGSSSTPQNNSSTTSGTTKSYDNIVLAYVTGSDLEERFAAATEDLNEMLTGYKKLSATQQKKTKLLVAFGGANTAGWRGVRYADDSCLIRDASDGIYGNDNCYSYESDNANMGSGGTLQDFLTFSLNDVVASKHSYLIFWNHGGAYKGVCYDSNKQGDRLTISELESALKESAIHIDLIGMDACLMSNIEVVKGIQSYGDYYLASEELEPAHGWDYESVIYKIGTNNAKSVATIGSELVDSYLDSTKHAVTANKTMALLKLSKAQKVVDNLDELTKRLDGSEDFKAIGLSVYDTQKFGVYDMRPDGITLDMIDFSQQIGTYKPSLKPWSDSLEQALEDMVVYARAQDEYAKGISMFQPLDDKDWNSYDNLYYVASTSWHSLLSSFVQIKASDREAPDVSSEHPCTQSGTSGQCLTVTDNIALKSVDSYGFVPFGDDALLLYSEILPSQGNDTFFMPNFDSKWFYLCDGSSGNRCIFPSAFELSGSTPNNRLFGTVGRYNGDDVYFLIRIKNSAITMWAIPDNEAGYSSKLQYEVKRGDTVQFQYFVLKGSGELVSLDGDALTFYAKPTWSKEDFNADITYVAYAEDFNNNSSFSNFYTTSGNASTSDYIIDTTSSQTRLAYLKGKKLTLNYDYYGTMYHESFTFNDDPRYDNNAGYYIQGVRRVNGAQGSINCFSDDVAKRTVVNGTSFMYDCPSFFNDGSKDLFVFNIDPEGAISGYYKYVDSGSVYSALESNPDAALVSSTIESVTP